MQQRDPIYAQADIMIETGDGPHQAAVDAIIAALSCQVGDPA